MRENQLTSDRKIPLREQLSYAMIEFALNPLYTIYASFLVFFYTDTIGVDAGIVGVIILVSKVFDGISDFFAGSIIDHTHTRHGSARPWVLRIAIPLLLAYIITFTVPSVGNVGKIAYIFISYNVSQAIIYTMADAAANALPTYMTIEPKTRSSSYAFRLLFAVIIQMIFSAIYLDMVEWLGGGQIGWILSAGIFGVIAAIALVIVFGGTKEAVRAEDIGKEDVPIWVAVKALLHNKYWFMALGLNFCSVLHQVATLTVGVYYAKYILNDATLVGALTLYHHIPAAVAMLALPVALQKGASKRNLAIVSGLIMLAGSIVSVIYASGAPFVLSLGLRGFGYGIVAGIFQGMIADTIEYGEWKTGIRAQGVTVSAGGAGQKLGAGIGTALLGIYMSMNGYDGTAAVQTDSAISAIRICFIFVPIVIYLATIVLGYFFKLDKQYPQIVKELEARHKGNS